MNNVFRLLILAIPFAIIFSGCNLLGGNDKKPAIPGKLVYASALDEPLAAEIFTSNTDGSGKKQLTYFNHNPFNYNYSSRYPVWSSDGTQIAFVSTFGANNRTGVCIYIMNADGSNIRPLAQLPNSGINVYGYNLSWSPDDSKLAFDQRIFCEFYPNCSNTSDRDIFYYDFKKDSIIQLTNTLTNRYPKWINNNELLFRSWRDQGSDIYKVDIRDKKSVERITNYGMAGLIVWNPHNEFLLLRTENSPFYTWYSIQPVTGDTLKEVELPVKFKEFDLEPIDWSINNPSLVMLRSTLYQNYDKISFYDFQEDKLYTIVEIPRLREVNWDY